MSLRTIQEDFAAGFARRGNAVHQQRQLQAVGHAQFLENRRQMGLDGAFGDAQRLGDLGIGPAAGRVTGGGGLALGQQAAIPVAGVLAFLGHQAQQAADQGTAHPDAARGDDLQGLCQPAAGVAVAVALGARGQDLGALFVVGLALATNRLRPARVCAQAASCQDGSRGRSASSTARDRPWSRQRCRSASRARGQPASARDRARQRCHNRSSCVINKTGTDFIKPSRSPLIK